MSILFYGPFHYFIDNIIYIAQEWIYSKENIKIYSIKVSVDCLGKKEKYSCFVLFSGGKGGRKEIY